MRQLDTHRAHQYAIRQLCSLVGVLCVWWWKSNFMALILLVILRPTFIDLLPFTSPFTDKHFCVALQFSSTSAQQWSTQTLVTFCLQLLLIKAQLWHEFDQGDHWGLLVERSWSMVVVSWGKSAIHSVPDEPEEGHWSARRGVLLIWTKLQTYSASVDGEHTVTAAASGVHCWWDLLATWATTSAHRTHTRTITRSNDD